MLVDEWQDINLPQYRLVQLLANGIGTIGQDGTDFEAICTNNGFMPSSSIVGNSNFCSSVFVVGDEDQRIYGWRGAVVDVVSSFMKDFEGCQIFTLEPNFRSTQVRTCMGV